MPYSNVTEIYSRVSSIVIDPVVIDIIRIVILTCLGEIIVVFGIAANVINIRVFKRLGYRDGVNVTLTCLAVSDNGALMVQLFYNIFVLPVIREDELVYVKTELLTDFLYWNEYFIRVSCCITSFASLERCLSVALPLKVKHFFTTKVAIVTNVSIFLFLSLYLVPPYYVVYYHWEFVPAWNRSIVSVLYTANGDNFLRLSYYFTDLLLPYSSSSVLIVCSAVIHIKLKSMSKWRQCDSRSGERSSNFSKERKTGVMLMTMSIMCVTLLLPKSAYFTTLAVVRELKPNGAYWDIARVVVPFASLLETINCSITIFVYYNMSTKYRSEFNKMFNSKAINVVNGPYSERGNSA